uniref:Uncharacterized protein n=1 Tax=Toxoplasma gondii COUG TaxID=1074873 RepID=A0A2G8XM85_TOXGO|nr:hypothetical protein TGCOUG_395870 [Toxoplasma gondii COUG]
MFSLRKQLRRMVAHQLAKRRRLSCRTSFQIVVWLRMQLIPEMTQLAIRCPAQICLRLPKTSFTNVSHQRRGADRWEHKQNVKSLSTLKRNPRLKRLRRLNLPEGNKESFWAVPL